MVEPNEASRQAAERLASQMDPSDIRALAAGLRSLSVLANRADLADTLGKTFRGQRDLGRVLGYKTKLGAGDYRERYRRGGIAKRLVEAFPMSTWRGGGEIVENDNPEVETAFEKAFFELNQRLHVWSTFQKVDILAGLGRFGVIILGAPGQSFEEELTRCRPEELAYLAPFSESSITVERYEEKISDPRFGLPLFYQLNKAKPDGTANGTARVHYSRVLHVAEGLLDDPMYGTPRLEAVWNYLDDLDKIVGGGAEAYWKRIDGGKQFKLDPTLQPDDNEVAALKEKIQLYTDGLERVLTTRGVDIQDLGSDVGNFKPGAEVLLDLIAGTTGIPQRILMGSERGQLASSTDQSNYDDRVEDRRNEYASTQIVRPFVDRMIALGVLPNAAQYETRWPEMLNLTDADRMALAKEAAEVNRAQGEIVFPSNEIRDRIMGWPALSEEELAELNVDDDEEEDVDNKAMLEAARNPNKKIRMLRLTQRGRMALRRLRAAA